MTQEHIDKLRGLDPVGLPCRMLAEIMKERFDDAPGSNFSVYDLVDDVVREVLKSMAGDDKVLLKRAKFIFNDRDIV